MCIFVVVGNWKMNGSKVLVVVLFNDLKVGLIFSMAEVLICVFYLFLD